ncbi:MAG: restriction endonuclease subunit S [Verrucomicrobiales bacterium]|nr:restriction endonuclease subunit S [Verrucomicrobiales bacterium]
MSFPRYPEYKESGVEWLGEVPAHWDVTPGRRLFRQDRTPALPEDEQLSATQKYGVIPQKLFMELEDQKVTLALSGLENFKHVEGGDFVISLRSFQGGIERSEHAGCVSPAYTVLKPDSSLHGRFWSYLLKSKGYIEALQSMTDGIRDGKSISYGQFGAILIPTVPTAEQTAIAAFLDRETAKIDALVAEQRRLIELLKEKRQAVISHAVTKGVNPDAPMKDSGIEWLGEVPAHWDIAGLTKYIPVLVDYRGRTPTKVDDGVFLVTAKNIRDGKIDYSASEEFIAENEYEDVMRRGKPEIGDVLFTTEAPLGQVANVDRRDVALAQRIIKFRGEPGVLDNYFLKYWLMGTFAQSDMEQLATGSTALGIKGSKVGQIRLCLPPYNEQVSIARFLDDELDNLDTLTAEAQRAIDLLQERRSALISAAVTGQIDVRHLAPAPQAE